MLVTVAIALLVLVAAWRAGSFALRAGGALLVVAGLLMLALGEGAADGLVAVLLGCGAWLGGHWLYALRHHEYRGPLAERIFLQGFRGRLDPTRRWVLPTAPAEPVRGSRRRRRPSER